MSVCVSGVGGAVYKMLIHDTYSREIVQIVWNADIWPQTILSNTVNPSNTANGIFLGQYHD